jgi:hypothetical protein
MFLRDSYEWLKVMRNSDKTDFAEVGRIYRHMAEILNQEANNILDENHETTIDR